LTDWSIIDEVQPAVQQLTFFGPLYAYESSLFIRIILQNLRFVFCSFLFINYLYLFGRPAGRICFFSGSPSLCFLHIVFNLYSILHS